MLLSTAASCSFVLRLFTLPSLPQVGPHLSPLSLKKIQKTAFHSLPSLSFISFSDFFWHLVRVKLCNKTKRQGEEAFDWRISGRDFCTTTNLIFRAFRLCDAFALTPPAYLSFVSFCTRLFRHSIAFPFLFWLVFYRKGENFSLAGTLERIRAQKWFKGKLLSRSEISGE